MRKYKEKARRVAETKKRSFKPAITTHQFIGRVYYANPDFSFEKTKYKNGKTPVIVTCCRCDQDISIFPEKYRSHIFTDFEGTHKNRFNMTQNETSLSASHRFFSRF
jgi:hypothetical protein